MNLINLFYLHLLSEAPTDPSVPWYAPVPVGKDTFQNKLTNMCKQASINGNKTNHSLRAASATQKYDSGVPEKLIQERTGPVADLGGIPGSHGSPLSDKSTYKTSKLATIL